MSKIDTIRIAANRLTMFLFVPFYLRFLLTFRLLGRINIANDESSSERKGERKRARESEPFLLFLDSVPDCLKKHDLIGSL